MTDVGILVDPRRCIACNACSIACMVENRFPGGVFATNVEEHNHGTYPSVSMHLVKRSCLHCRDPICVRVCPSQAMGRSENGAVDHRPELCIGCGYCAFSCPFQVPKVTKGTAHKCTMCGDRVARGEKPACVATCPTSALVFGDREDLAQRAKERLAQLKAIGSNACVYNPAGVGGTSVLYVLCDRPSAFGLPEEPRVSGAVRIWQDLVKPYATWLIPLAMLGTIVSLVTTRLAKRGDEDEREEED